MLTVVADESSYSVFTVTNIVGQVLMKQIINSSETRVKLDKLVPAVYYIVLTGKNGTVSRRFVKVE